MKNLIIVLIATVMLSWWMACSDDKNPLPSKSHPQSWSQIANADFHGNKVKTAGYESCRSCHGVDYRGGVSKVSCFKCHESYPHLDGWMNVQSSRYHGVFLKEAQYQLDNCTACHGGDYQGGSSGVSCYKCHANYPHKSKWSEQGHSDFHGTFLKNANWILTECSSCHGANFQGGLSESSCYTCHASYPHLNGWLNPGNNQFHGQFIRATSWSMASCKSCHGQNYRGDDTGASCYLCHTQPTGPEACNTCHGSAVNNAPPQDLNNQTNTGIIGVGAHQLHVARFPFCAVCHADITAFNDPHHIDATPYAEILEVWSWNRNTRTCVTGCHSNPAKQYIWTF